METMLIKKTNVTLNSGLPPFPKRPSTVTDQPSGGASFSKVAPLPSGSSGTVPAASNSFQFWTKLDQKKDQIASSTSDCTHSRSNRSECGVEFKEPESGTVNVAKLDGQSEIDVQFELARKRHPDMDPRKLRRIVTNRISAQRSRLRRIKYVNDLEDKKESLEAQISELSSEISLESNKKEELLTEKISLRQRISYLTNDEILKNVEKKMLRKEVDRLIEELMKQKEERERLMTSTNGWNIQAPAGQNGANISSGEEDANMLDLIEVEMMTNWDVGSSESNYYDLIGQLSYDQTNISDDLQQVLCSSYEQDGPTVEQTHKSGPSIFQSSVDANSELTQNYVGGSVSHEDESLLSLSQQHYFSLNNGSSGGGNICDIINSETTQN